MTIKPTIIKDFIDEKTKNILNDWCLSNWKSHYFYDANMGIFGTRMTTRYHTKCDDINFPKEALDIRDSIPEKLNFGKYRHAPFCHGIVNGIGFERGTIYTHKDPVYFDNTYTVHCNIITKKSLFGGTTFIEGIPYETEETDLLIYPVSEVEHYVDEIRGNVPRILWVFGYCLEIT